MQTRDARGWWCTGILWGCRDGDGTHRHSPPELLAASLPVIPHQDPHSPGQEDVPNWAPNAGGCGALISC